MRCRRVWQERTYSLNRENVFGIVEWHGNVNHRRWKSCKLNSKNTCVRFLSTAEDPRSSAGIQEDHLLRLNTLSRPIVYKYREGKVKRTPEGEWNRTWNCMPTSSRSPSSDGWRRAYWRMSQRVILSSKVKGSPGAEGKPSLNRAWVG